MESAVHRIAKTELGIDVKIINHIGFFEKIYPSRHDISHCFLTSQRSEKIHLDFQASESQFFSKTPNQIATFLKKMIKQARF